MLGDLEVRSKLAALEREAQRRRLLAAVEKGEALDDRQLERLAARDRRVGLRFWPFPRGWPLARSGG